MFLLPLAFGIILNNPSYPHSEELITALYQEFEPSLVPQFYQIALCESSIRQFDDNGEVLTSSTTDYGILQINKVHEAEAVARGLDFKGSLEDNVKMAKVVYDKQGFGAWTCAKKVGVI